jgi:hypothetical protein
MRIGTLFWILMLLWLLFGLWVYWPGSSALAYAPGGNLLLFVVIALLGWKVFGSPLRD